MCVLFNVQYIYIWRLISCFSVLSLCFAADLASPDCPDGLIDENQMYIGTKNSVSRNSLRLWKCFNQIMKDEGIKFKSYYNLNLLDCKETLFDSLLSVLVYFKKTTMNVKAVKTMMMRLGSVERMQNVWTHVAAFTASVWMVSCHQQALLIFLLILLSCVMVGDAA